LESVQKFTEEEWELFTAIYDEAVDSGSYGGDLDRERKLLLDRIRDKVYQLAPDAAPKFPIRFDG